MGPARVPVEMKAIMSGSYTVMSSVCCDALTELGVSRLCVCKCRHARKSSLLTLKATAPCGAKP